MAKDFVSLKEVNREIKKDELKVIRDAESRYRGQLFELVNSILERKGGVKLVLVAGPSCAGKTTSALLLRDILTQKGKDVCHVEMDNFFKSWCDRKILPDGSVDFDSIDVVNLDLIEKCFARLLKNGVAMFPKHDFVSGINYPNKIKYQIKKNTIIILEGIHVLNPILIERLGIKNYAKVYVDMFTGFRNESLAIDGQNFRLVRRMVRDMSRRGVTPEKTLSMWGNICKAESEYIAPFKGDADYLINSSHSYEMGLYKGAILEGVRKGVLSFEKLPWLALFKEAEEVDISLIPKTTLMKEFINLD